MIVNTYQPFKGPYAGMCIRISIYRCVSVTFLDYPYGNVEQIVRKPLHIISRGRIYRRTQKNKFYRVKIIFSSLKSPPNSGSYLDFALVRVYHTKSHKKDSKVQKMQKRVPKTRKNHFVQKNICCMFLGIVFFVKDAKIMIRIH